MGLIVRGGFLLLLGLALPNMAQAGIIIGGEPFNTFGTAQVIPASAFDTTQFFNPSNAFQGGIGAPTIEYPTANHVSVTILGVPGSASYDFYRFTVPWEGKVILDIDSVPLATNFDTMIFLWDAAGNFIAANDDNGNDAGDTFALVGGFFNSRLSLDLALGDYVVGVGRFFTFRSGTTLAGSVPGVNDQYTLNITVNTPEPTSLAIFGLVGLCGAAYAYRRKNATA